MRHKTVLLSGLIFVLLSMPMVSAQQPQQPTSRVIPFNGSMPGEPDGSVEVTLGLFPTPSGGTACFEETQTVDVSEEIFFAYIGNGTPGGLAPSPCFTSNSSLWVEVVVRGTPLEPRTPLTASAFALFTPAPVGPPGGINGIRDFTANGTFTAPQGITRVMVEAWGAGGGGGGSANLRSTQIGSSGGGGGGGGGYVRGVVNVVPGATYNIFIGAGGSGGPVSTAGGAGGDTNFRTSENVVLIRAGGGAGGGAGAPGSGGSGGAGGQGDPSGGISARGLDGETGTVRFDARSTVRGGVGGQSAVIGTRLPSKTLGGSGGTPTPFGGAPGSAGQPGYMIIQW